MARYLFLALSLLLGVAWASIPIPETIVSNLERTVTRDDEINYRLTNAVLPTYYSLQLTPYFEATATREIFTFDGVVTITFTVTVDGLNQLVLHEDVREILSIVFINQNGVETTITAANIIQEPEFELLRINPGTNLVIGQSYGVRITYIGNINQSALDRGFYLGYYIVDGVTRYYATTQFQPAHARKAFPSFDEPALKAVFSIAITRPITFQQSYSNMAISNTVTNAAAGTVTETFADTPIMPTYLIAFHVSDFVVASESSNASRPLRIIARPNAAYQGEYALEVADALTVWLGDYLDVPYYDMHPGIKNDHIALPDFPSGAMENWGMVNYREPYLLYTEDTNLIFKQYVASIVSHELAHKWFGNLVTCHWWSNIWLNEAFASYFEYFATHAVEPWYELDDQFIVGYVQSALTADSSPTIGSLNNPSVLTPTQIWNHFSTITYAKGSSLLRMLEHFVGPSTFQLALQIYLKRHSFDVGYPVDMYRAFEEAVAETGSLAAYPNTNITYFFRNFVDFPGYPVINVEANHDTGDVIISQERFVSDGSSLPGFWHVPITYTTGNNPSWDNTTAAMVLTGHNAILRNVLEGHTWIIFNIKHSSFFRVNYDDHTWDIIANTLRQNRESIHYLNRAQIVSDVFAFIFANKLSLDRALNVLEFLNQETNYYVWDFALIGWNNLRRRFIHLEEFLTEFENFMLSDMEAAINHVGYAMRDSDTASEILLRTLLLHNACSRGHQACVNTSQTDFNALVNEGTTVPADLRRHTFCVGVREGGAAAFEFLWQRYVGSNNDADKVAMLRALACTRDEASLLRYLQLTMSSEHIRLHDRVNAITFALQGNEENVPAVQQFVQTNYQAISQDFGGEDRLLSVLSNIAAFLTTEAQFTSYQAFLTSSGFGTTYPSLTSALAAARTRVEWGNTNQATFASIFASRNSANNIVASFTLILSVLTTMFVKYA